MKDYEERSGGIQVIARAAAIMRLLGQDPEGLSLGAMATKLGLARSTVQRIVQALEVEGFVEPLGPSGGFRLGPLLSKLVYRRQIDVVTSVRPFLEALCTELEETAALCEMTCSSLTTLDRCIAERPLRVVFPLGTIPFPAHKLAPGRAILSAMQPERAKRALADLVQEDAIDGELARLRAHKGPALDAETFIPDISGLAVPLQTHLGLYSLTVILPLSRLEGRKREIANALSACRIDIESKLGGM